MKLLSTIIQGSYQKLFLLMVTLLCFVKLSISQSKVSFELIDSLEFKLDTLGSDSLFEDGYGINIFDNYIFIYPLEQSTVFKYDLTSKKIVPIPLEMKKKKDAFGVRHLDITKNCIAVMNYDASEVRIYSWNGKLQKRFKPKFEAGYHLHMSSSFEYDETNDLLYLPIKTEYNETFISKNPKKANKYYARKGLIGVFDSTGKMQGKIGQYDSYYHGNQYYYADFYSFLLNSKDQIILSQQLSSNLSLIEFKSGKNEERSFKGNFITTTWEELPKVHQTLSNEQYNTHAIQSFGYYSAKEINNNGLYVRRYENTSLDTTKQTIEKPDDNLDKSLVCKAPTQRELNQQKILDDKPQYIQVININNGKVLYDNRSPFKGEILTKAEHTNYLWTSVLSLENFKIYQYSIITR